MMTSNIKEHIQNKLHANGIFIEYIDKDHVSVMIDGEIETFSRDDQYGGHMMSGLASFGGIHGDHRMIAAIAQDVKLAFHIIDIAITELN